MCNDYSNHSCIVLILFGNGYIFPRQYTILKWRQFENLQDHIWTGITVSNSQSCRSIFWRSSKSLQWWILRLPPYHYRAFRWEMMTATNYYTPLFLVITIF